MKRIIVLALSLIICAGLFAQDFTPYGSARVGYWFDMYNEDVIGPDGRTFNTFELQQNSRIGFNYKKGDLTAKAEIGITSLADKNSNEKDGLAFRYLWAKHNFGSFSLGVGLDDDGFDKRANQVYNGDMQLEGFGAVYSNRNAQIKFEMPMGDNLLYISAQKPYTAKNPADDADGISDFIPRFNLGYNVDLGDIKIYPTASFQMYSYNPDFTAATNESEATVMSWLVGATVDFKADVLSIRGNFNLGSNTANLYENFTKPRLSKPHKIEYTTMGTAAELDPTDNEATIDYMSMGGFITVGYDISDVINVGGGFGFTSNAYKEDYDNDTRMAFYLQSVMKAGNFSFIPEFGMFMLGNEPQDKDYEGDDVARGSLMYIGTQLRYSF